MSCTVHSCKSLYFSALLPHTMLVLLPGAARLSSLICVLSWEKGLQEKRGIGRTLEMEQDESFKQGKPQRRIISSSVGQWDQKFRGWVQSLPVAPGSIAYFQGLFLKAQVVRTKTTLTSEDHIPRETPVAFLWALGSGQTTPMAEASGLFLSAWGQGPISEVQDLWLSEGR